MKTFSPHIVVAEREFLIALDAEYLIKSALECRITLLRPEQLDQWDGAALADIDLCLYDMPLNAEPVTARIHRLIAAGVPLLFTAVLDVHPEGIADFAGIPVVRKPFDGERLAALVREGLRQRPQPAGQDGQN